MWLPLQLAAEVTCICFPSLYMYLLLVQIDNNNNNNAHFGYVHHLNNIIGGASMKTTWRWCVQMPCESNDGSQPDVLTGQRVFYVNLPFCGIALISLPFLLLADKPRASTLFDQLSKIDWIGSVLIVLG